MKETSKAHPRRRENWAFVNRYFVGHGLDVGSGNDPLREKDWPNVTSVTCYDAPDGSGEGLPEFGHLFDFVYASNVLEHMSQPLTALCEWIRVCRFGGHIIFTVPDFVLYECGHWPSKWNAGHRHSFDIEKIISLIDDVNVDYKKGISEPVLDIKKIELIDTRYDYSLRMVDQTLPEDGAEAFIEVVLQRK
jgi:SAM-dependent methyltransferase